MAIKGKNIQKESRNIPEEDPGQRASARLMHNYLNFNYNLHRQRQEDRQNQPPALAPTVNNDNQPRNTNQRKTGKQTSITDWMRGEGI